MGILSEDQIYVSYALEKLKMAVSISTETVYAPLRYSKYINKISYPVMNGESY
jgi:hypothetical protein